MQNNFVNKQQNSNRLTQRLSEDVRNNKAQLLHV